MRAWRVLSSQELCGQGDAKRTLCPKFPRLSKVKPRTRDLPSASSSSLRLSSVPFSSNPSCTPAVLDSTATVSLSLEDGHSAFVSLTHMVTALLVEASTPLSASTSSSSSRASRPPKTSSEKWSLSALIAHFFRWGAFSIICACVFKTSRTMTSFLIRTPMKCEGADETRPLLFLLSPSANPSLSLLLYLLFLPPEPCIESRRLQSLHKRPTALQKA
mmetsp:Transcript_48975/g.96587  ORF Transcript_48975/g.96587 Transcript_48975/m.96587 type:complete len:217 (-) Transcript_48975:183-833(-)